MGLIERLLMVMFGGGGNLVRETAEVFRENAEARATREADQHGAALEQFAAEFLLPRQGRFDRLMDGINRLPVDPGWFAARMQGVALVPEPLWWLLGVVVSFYFGARHQQKSQEFQRSLAATFARAPQVIARARQDHEESNAALDDWRSGGE